MIITEQTKRAIPFKSGDAKRVGDGCFYLDQIVWLNGEHIEMDDGVGFNYGCYVNGIGGLIIGEGTIFGPYTMIHTANHKTDDLTRPIPEQGWEDAPPVQVGPQCWIGMGVCILPGVRIGEGCVIGAGSVLTTDLDAYTVAVGNPAEPVKSRR
ncbi:MAG TPA: acyltransferase [Acidimicrobiales bacterium]|nr:acyltransferase [Acidimicrobiales bacterium]